MRDPHNLRTRRIGAGIAVEVHVRVDPSLSVLDSHRIASGIETRIRARHGAWSHVIVHVEPDESAAPPAPDPVGRARRARRLPPFGRPSGKAPGIKTVDNIAPPAWWLAALRANTCRYHARNGKLSARISLPSTQPQQPVRIMPRELLRLGNKRLLSSEKSVLSNNLNLNYLLSSFRTNLQPNNGSLFSSKHW